MKKLRNFGKPYTMGLLKELLIGLIILFGFISFSSASRQVVDDEIIVLKNSNGDGYNPASINFKYSINTYVVNREISGGGNCGGKISASWGSKYFNTWNGLNTNRNGVVDISCDPSGNYVCCDKVVFTHYGSSDKMPVSALSPAISGLTSSINEFIPLMVYVGLGVLGAVIGFFAIKWLISYVGKEIFTMFKK